MMNAWYCNTGLLKFAPFSCHWNCITFTNEDYLTYSFITNVPYTPSIRVFLVGEFRKKSQAVLCLVTVPAEYEHLIWLMITKTTHISGPKPCFVYVLNQSWQEFFCCQPCQLVLWVISCSRGNTAFLFGNAKKSRKGKDRHHHASGSLFLARQQAAWINGYRTVDKL